MEYMDNVLGSESSGKNKNNYFQTFNLLYNINITLT